MNISRMLDKDRALRIQTEIRSVLMADWDPINVKDEPMAADEYDSYIGGVYGLLMRNASDEEISDHLREIEIKSMGYAEEQVPNYLGVATTLKRISLD